jgi:dihydrolipoamide dehydrogenase
VGCIPSKALLYSSEQLVFTRDHAAEHGIRTGAVAADIAALMRRKDAVVSKLVGGIAVLAKARKVAVLTGEAAFASPTLLSVKGPAGTVSVAARNFVIATGSAPVELPFVRFDGRTVVSSDQALSFEAAPPSLVVVGGGAIGLELGSVWARLGSSVTVVEFLPKIVAGYDDDVVRLFSRLLQKQGLRIETGAKVTGMRTEGGRAVLAAEREGKALEFPADKILVAVGRRPYTDGLGLEAAGVARSTRRGASRWIRACARECRESGRSVMSWPGPCSRTRPRRTGSPWQNGSRGGRATSTGTSCPPSSTRIPR